ncbi:MAG: DUF2586 family protein [Bacteroidales bacterium]
MALPGVHITLGNGSLGQAASYDDGVAGLILTGSAITGKLELNKHYLLGSTKDLITLGISIENNPLIDKEVKAFYSQCGEGAELHLLVVSAATTLTTMCDPAEGSPISTLIQSGGGRIRLLGLNKISPAEYVATLTHGIDEDAITAASKAQQVADSFASKIMPFRIFMPAPAWNGTTDTLFKPNESSYNRVAFVLASDAKVSNVYPAAIGMVLGRAAKAEAQQCLGRVRFGSLASQGYFTSGHDFLEKGALSQALDAAGYIFFINYPSKNGCYLNGNPMATPATDDYCELNNGRIIDKAMCITYNTYISEIMDNVEVDEMGALSSGVCKNFEGMIENAINASMGNQISSFSAYVNPKQNVLSTKTLEIACSIVPLGVLKRIEVTLAFSNPARG